MPCPAIGLQAVDRLKPSEYWIDTTSGQETRASQPGFSHKLLKKCDFAVKWGYKNSDFAVETGFYKDDMLL